MARPSAGSAVRVAIVSAFALFQSGSAAPVADTAVGTFTTAQKSGKDSQMLFLKGKVGSRNLYVNVEDREFSTPSARGTIRLTTHCYAPKFTPGKDVCLLLEPKATSCRNRTILASESTKYTVTFKGGVLTTDPGMLRMNLFGVSNELLGIYFVGRCSEFIRKVHPTLAKTLKMCYKLGLDWDAFNYCDLMTNTVYSLVPEGRQPASYRFLEVLCMGSIPIVYTDKNSLYWPFASTISAEQWTNCVHVTTQRYQITLIAYQHHTGGTDAKEREPHCQALRSQICTREQRQALYTKEVLSIPDVLLISPKG
jgi:hypothetical protein